MIDLEGVEFQANFPLRLCSLTTEWRSVYLLTTITL